MYINGKQKYIKPVDDTLEKYKNVQTDNKFEIMVMTTYNHYYNDIEFIITSRKSAGTQPGEN